MKEYNYILFDLDGTLTEPAEGITNSVKYALEKYGILEVTTEELLKFIGPPLQDSFMEYYHFSEEDAIKAVGYYREYFSDKGIFENRVYDGIPELLGRLKQKGKKLFVATSKPEKFTNRILEHFDLAKYFEFVAGATMDNTRTKKADIIAYALEHIPSKDYDKVIMVGDRHHDIDGAITNQIDAIGVLYGYGTKEELTKAGAAYIVSGIEELENLIV